MEVWRDIKGYEGIYMISDQGRVKFDKEKILKPGRNPDGYLLVILSKDKIRKTCTIHRLLCLNFLDNPNNQKTINHINGIKDDNRLENLEWCSQSHNVKHAFNNGLKISSKGINHGRSKLTEKQIIEIRSSNLKGVELGRLYGVDHTTISLIKRRKNWKHI